MRATRVIETTNSIFRNSRQYLHSNEQIFRVMQEGELSQFAGGQRNRKRKKQQERSHSSQKAILKTTLNRINININTLRYDAMAIASLQNHLLKHSEQIEAVRNKVTCIRAYRSSI